MRGCPSTRWSIISKLARPDEEARERSIAEFLEAYRRPLEAYLNWRFASLSLQDREDLLQGFIADRMLAHNLYETAMRGTKDFRPYLQRTLVNYVIDDLRRRSRDRAKFEQLASEASVPDASPDPYDIEWARVVIVEAIARLRQDCIDGDRLLVWDVFDLRVHRHLFHDQPAVGYPALAEKFGRTESELRNLLVTGKRMLRRHLMDIVKGYVVGDSSAEEELKDLQRIVAGGQSVSVNA